jgi:cytochrome c oxidase subunit 2
MFELMRQWLYIPAQASSHAAEIDQMTVFIHWFMLLLFVGWGAFFVYCIVRFRRGASPKASYTGVKSHFSNYVEIGVAAVEAVLLIGFAVPLWANRVNAFPAEGESTVVRVVGEQFAWNVHYPGRDGRFGRRDISLVSANNPLGLDRNDPGAKDDITTINQLNLPVDRPVLVHLSTKDVIHSFGLLEMRVKQDAIPGMEIPVWFVPTRAGNYEITCSQLCGLGHYRMRGFVTIQTQAEYDTWLAEEEKNIPAATGN